MNTTSKVLGALGLAGLVLAIKGKLSNAEPEPEPEDELNGDVSITIYDEYGNVVPRNSPYNLNEGGYYTLKFTVKNSSTRGGTPWPATLTMSYSVTINGAVQASNTVTGEFAAGETRTFGAYGFSIPWNIKGTGIGSVSVTSKSPSGSVLDTDSEIINVIGVDVPKAIVNGIVVKTSSGTIVQPSQMSEDDSYKVYVSVTNQTSNGGELISGYIKVLCKVRVSGQTLLDTSISQSMSSGQTLEVGPFYLDLPWDLSGSGTIDGTAAHPTTGTSLSIKTQTINVSPDERWNASITSVYMKTVAGVTVTTPKEGSTYNVYFSIKNESSQGGIQIPAVYPFKCVVTAGGSKILDQAGTASLTAGETKQVGPYSLALPWDISGEDNGVIDAMIYHPVSGSLLKASSVIFDIEAVPIIYGADIEIV
jgi:hypothetical protein